MFDERSTANRFKNTIERGQYANGRYMYTGKRQSDGTITLSGAADNKVWVRAEEDSREETQVWGTAQKVNVRVWVQPNAAGELAIREPDYGASAYGGQAGIAGALLPAITPENVPNLLVDGRQFRPGRLRYSALGGLYVYIEGFHYPGGYFPGADFQMTAPSTASKQAWCAVALNPATGTLSQVTGTEYPLTFIMTSTEAGAITFTAGYIPCGAIVLYNGQTTIDGNEKIDDLRYHFAQAGSDITGFVKIAPDSDTRNTVQPSGDHPALILKNNAGQTDNPFQTQTSAGAVNVAITPLGGLTVNEQGADADTRIEGDTDANLVFVDASTDRVGIGTNSPATKLHVNGGSALDGAVTINDSGADVDTRIEGDTATHAVFVDASLDAVGINQSTIAASAVLDVASTTKGVLVPRMNTTQRDAISSPATGLMIYNTSTSTFQFYNGASWASIGAGAATITVKEADGTPNVSGVSTVVVSNGTLTDDGGGQVTITTGGGGAGTTVYGVCNGRLTLTSGTAVTTSDVTAATTLYFTPYKGNQIGIYNGSSWSVYTFSEISLSLSGYTASKPYDIWAYISGGSVTLDSTVWTNDTTRATALTTQDGVYVKSGDTTRRYLGTIRITGTTGQTEDSLTSRFVWNYYNRVQRELRKLPSTGSWGYVTASWRYWNNSSANRVESVVGVQEDAISLTLNPRGYKNNNAIGVNTSSSVATGVTQAANDTASTTITTSSSYRAIPSLGYSYYALIEYGNASFANEGSSVFGLLGHVLG